MSFLAANCCIFVEVFFLSTFPLKNRQKCQKMDFLEKNPGTPAAGFFTAQGLDCPPLNFSQKVLKGGGGKALPPLNFGKSPQGGAHLEWEAE